MLKKVYKGYKKFFDEKIGNGTTVVSMIALLIVAIGSCTPNAQILKANAFEASSIIQHDDTVTIDGKKFKVLLQETQ